MKGSEFVATLDAKATPAREAAILQAVRDQLYRPIQWFGIQSKIGSHSCILYVASDALAIGEEDDYVRVNVTHRTAQQIADVLGYALPTTKISDLAFMQASVVILPCTQKPDMWMAHTARMVQHSNAVTSNIYGRVGLVAPVGKDWVLTNKLVGKPHLAANYGWHVNTAPFVGPGGAHVYQPLGLAHNLDHVDYSQVLRLVNRCVVVDGQDMLLEDVLTSDELSLLLSDEGTLKITRHPGVEQLGDGQPAPLVCGG